MSDVVTLLAALVIVVVGLGLGSSTTVGDFQVAVKKPKAVAVGWCSQYIFMPLFAFVMATISGLSDPVAVGLILTGSSPGGTTSNLFTYWAKGDVALSITMSFMSTVAAFFMLPLLIVIYIRTLYNVSVAIPWLNIVVALFLIVIPTGLGLALRRYNKTWKLGDKLLWEWCEKITSVFGAIFVVGALISGIIVYKDDLAGAPWPLWIFATVMEPLGAVFGFGAARFANLTMKDARTIALECGVQNFTLTLAIIALSFEGKERDRVLLFPIMYGVMYLVNSAWLVALFRFFLIKYDEEGEEGAQDRTGAADEGLRDVEKSGDTELAPASTSNRL